MKKSIIVIICLLTALVYSCNSNAPKAKYVEMAKEVNAKMPMELGNGIRMDKAEAVSADEFKYSYTFLSTPALSTDDFIKATKGLLATAVKNQPDMKIFRDDKMTIVYVYNTSDNKLFAEIKITPEDYK